MRFFPRSGGVAALASVASWLSGCTMLSNYTEAEGPRYAGSYAAAARASDSPGIRVVSFNVKFAEEIQRAIDELGRAELSPADAILLQEMDQPGVDAIARALHLNYVYYPASVHTNGRDFGNAILTPWAIVEDEKILLPHTNPKNGQRRMAVRALIETDRASFEAYSVHIETMWLGLEARLDQMRAVIDSVPRETPAVIGGDFNTSDPGSVSQAREIFRDAGFAWATEGVGSTASAGPVGLSLDHVFSRGYRVLGSAKLDASVASDHLPVRVDLTPN